TEITATATIATAQYNYVFTGFTGTVDTVTGNVEITANFTRTINWNDISTTAEFVAMLSAAKAAASQDGGFTGYYRLTNDLDFTGVDVVSSLMLTNNQVTSKNWQATFDGQGYALSNIDFSWINNNGLFGEIGAGGVVKNVAIINPMSGENNKFNGYGGIIACNSAGLIENVYVKVASINDNALNGGLVRYCAAGSVLRNCVIEYAGGNLTNAALYVKTNGGASIRNCYAITSATFPDSASGTTKESITALYDTENNGLTMLTKSESTLYWGSTALGEYVAIEWNDISTTDEFVSMLAAAKAAASQDGGFTGYYRLTQSLDFTGVNIAGNFMLTNNQVASKNWQATFDGQGYALSNLNYSWQNTNGLFGEIGTNGVIRNVAIINPEYSTTNEFKGYGGIIAWNNAGLIENVYVKINAMAENANNAGLVRYAMSGSIIRNCVVEYAGGNLSTAKLYVQSNGGATISNCYAVTTASFPDSAVGTTKATVAALYETENNGLTMLTKTNETYYWGNVAL
ncbi:MAG: hypothetical protein J6Y43_00270, partial [Clostridia bacterium]|nr:hypothetical protein [Clostridia bacterium]